MKSAGTLTPPPIFDVILVDLEYENDPTAIEIRPRMGLICIIHRQLNKNATFVMMDSHLITTWYY